MHSERCPPPDVIRSNTTATPHRPGPGRSVKPLALIIILLMVLSSGMILLSSSHASGSSDAAGHSDTPYRAAPDTAWKGWDWRQMASDSDLVDVILSFRQAGDSDDDEIFSIIDLMETHSRRGDITLKHVFTNIADGFSARMSPDVLEELLEENPTLEAYPDLQVQAFMGESVLSIGADEIWSMTDPYGHAVTGYGMVIAVIDTGIDYTHPDLGGGFGPSFKVIGGYDFYNHDSDPMDDNGHGTHVAGVVAADGGMIGVAPDARLLAYKSLGSDGAGSMSDVIAAIDAAIDPNGDGDPEDRADVISMSLGGQGEVGDPICMAVQRAVEAGVVVVVAAGNSGPSMNTVASPGVSPYAVTVGAVDDSGTLASFSSRGPTPDMTIKPDLSAPGVNIVSTVPMTGAEMSNPTGYMAMSGTSMATPHVSGAAALLLQLHPDWSPSKVKSALVLGASEIDESVWSAGAGEVWIPESAEMRMFYSQPIISYGLIDNPSQSIAITNTGPSITISSDSSDWFSLYADGEEAIRQWTNASSISPTLIIIPSGATGQMTISVVLVNGHPEGYYEGDMILTSSAGVERLPFGFVILSRLSVHVLDMDGHEVFDPYGGVWVFDLPDAEIAMGMRGNIEPAPPAIFFLPSGTYSVHSFGHQLLYSFSNPYILSTTVTLDRVEMVDVYLRMSDARIVTIDLGTYDGVPIYVKDYRVYCRHEGGTNISFDLGGSDYSVVGSDVFSIPDSVDVLISDTDEQIGISIAGFSYSAAMWDFMELNWENWYEYVSGTSTEFMVEASADLQYLMSWEFDGVDSSIPTVLGLDPDLTSTYVTKYDIPGAVLNPWCDWGTHRSIGGDATFFVRRDTDTSLNPFFSGMTRTTFVQGVFSELYYPYSIFEGFIERQFYEPDYDHVVDALTMSKIQVPDRYYITPLPATTETQRIGAGPFYPSLYTSNTNDAFVLFQPLLRDQSGAKVGGMFSPSMTLYRGGSLIGVYGLSEYLARPDAVRIIDLTEDGEYSAKITYEPSSQVTDSIDIELGFTVPGDDIDPPHVTALQMPQRFVPGESFDITLGVADEQSVDAVISWRPTGSDTWTDLSVVASEPGVFETSLTTGASDTAIDLKIDISDPSGNYLVATMTNAALKERDVLFELYPMNDEVSYRTAPNTVLLMGALTDGLGNPISPTAGIPLELMVDGEKVGMILDEYITPGAHSHDGDIRFEWRLSASTLFSGPGQTVEVSVEFDLGTYGYRTAAFTLTSIESTNLPPVISLISPGNGSLISTGTPIDLEIVDDGPVSAEAFLDGESLGPVYQPWDIDTGEWADGTRELTIVATDDQLEEAVEHYEFVVDGTPPEVTITYPPDDTTIPRGGTLTAEIVDDHISTVQWSQDGGGYATLDYPYTIDMSGWTIGPHTVEIVATDMVGLSTSASVDFEISDRAIVINLLSPENGSVINSGVPIELSVLGDGNITCIWTTDGVTWHSITDPYSISTVGWEEGAHSITVNATDGPEGSDEMVIDVIIDDTPPEILLVSPDAESFVDSSDQLHFDIVDDNFKQVSWTIWGEMWTGIYPEVHMPLTDSPADGYFTVALTATDEAGNTNSESYTFAMDSAPPTVIVENVITEGSISPDEPIELTVDDAFLASVLFSLDDGAVETLSAPYDIDLSLVSLGWHTIQITATDLSGQTTELDQSIYVDGTSPTITTDIEENVTSDQDVEIRAHVTDDFAVGTVVAYYENEHGVFLGMQMSMDDDSFMAMLDAQLLLDGMVVYVYASDLSGNSAESERITLHVTVVPDEEEDDDTSGNAGISAAQAAGIAGIVAAVAALLYILYDRRFRRKCVAASPEEPDGTTAAPAPAAPIVHEQPEAAPEKPAEPAGQDFMPKIMISETGVVYCKPIKVPADRIVRRPPIQRTRPTGLTARDKTEEDTDVHIIEDWNR